MIVALSMKCGGGTASRRIEDIADDLVGRMFDAPGCGVGMEKDLF